MPGFLGTRGAPEEEPGNWTLATPMPLRAAARNLTRPLAADRFRYPPGPGSDVCSGAACTSSILY
jgi:hypothetical protein